MCVPLIYKVGSSGGNASSYKFIIMWGQVALPHFLRLCYPIGASLLSSLGELNVRHASLYAPAAYIISYLQCRPLISRILGHTAKPPVLVP